MHTQTETQPERGVRVNDIISSAEKWYGVSLRVKDESRFEEIKKGLETILAQEGYKPPKTEGNMICSKGQYDDKTALSIYGYLKYLESLGGVLECEPVIAEGTRDHFYGDRWLKKAETKR